MCGIAGFSLKTDEDINANKLGSALLHQIVTRGAHATGMAFVTGKPENRLIKNYKSNVNAFEFVKKYGDKLPVDAKTAIFHTRYATLGSPLNNLNNHPIRVGDVVGVHNGHVSNHQEIFQNYTSHRRKAEVDSEAIFSMLASYKNSESKPTDLLGLLDGGAAVAWLDTRTGTDLHLARCCNSPLAVAQTAAGSFIFASTDMLLGKAVKDAGIKLEWIEQIPEWSYIKVRRGRLVEYTDITQYESANVLTAEDALALELAGADHSADPSDDPFDTNWKNVDMWTDGY
jgi:glucosamine 6-phosphate synthetase-like amidotransferase/phosphosugar isomerase protein